MRITYSEGMLFFGDDFGGYCGGFLTTNNWRLVEDDGSCDLYEPEMTFKEFVWDKELCDIVLVRPPEGGGLISINGEYLSQINHPPRGYQLEAAFFDRSRHTESVTRMERTCNL